MRTASSSLKRRLAIVLGIALLAALVIAGISSGLGHESVPSGDVAVVEGVDGGTVSQDDIDRALTQAAIQNGLQEPPPSDDPQYQTFLDQAMQSQLFVIWVREEAKDRGISVDEEEIQAEIDRRKKEQGLDSPEKFQKFLDQSQLTEEDIHDQVESELLQEELSKEVVPSNPDPATPVYSQEELAEIYGIDDAAVEDFYDTNQEAFAVTASRDVRVILNTSEDKVDQAKEELEADDSDESWAKVAAKFSQDEASKSTGGQYPQPLVEGTGDPQLEEQVFSAAEGELVGPFETDRGFYLAEVTGITEAGTRPLDKQLKLEITAQLITAAQQQVGTEFRNDFIDKWTQRTTCLPEYAIQLCRGFVAPPPEPVAGQPETPDPPPVSFTSPVEPGTVTISPGTTQQGLPQGPLGGPAPVPAPTALPEGAVPVGPDGAPAAGATGTVPPTGAAPPTGTVPPG